MGRVVLLDSGQEAGRNRRMASSLAVGLFVLAAVILQQAHAGKERCLQEHTVEKLRSQQFKFKESVDSSRFLQEAKSKKWKVERFCSVVK